VVVSSFEFCPFSVAKLRVKAWKQVKMSTWTSTVATRSRSTVLHHSVDSCSTKNFAVKSLLRWLEANRMSLASTKKSHLKCSSYFIYSGTSHTLILDLLRTTFADIIRPICQTVESVRTLSTAEAYRSIMDLCRFAIRSTSYTTDLSGRRLSSYFIYSGSLTVIGLT